MGLEREGEKGWVGLERERERRGGWVWRERGREGVGGSGVGLGDIGLFSSRYDIIKLIAV